MIKMFFNVLLIHIVSFGYCADILALVPCPMYSHQVAFYDLWNQLSLRGHKVTVITTDPQRNETLTNLTEIDVSWSYKFFENVSSEAEKTLTPWMLHPWLHHTSYVISEAQLQYQPIQELLYNKKRHFDVIFVEFLYPEYLGFAVIYNCPIILFSSLDIFTNLHHAVGNPSHPALYTNIGSPFYAPLSFKERLTNTIYSLHSSYFYNYMSYPQKQRHMSRFFNTTSTINELLGKIDMVFLNVDPVIQPVRAIGPATINIGGLRNMSPKPLPPDLAKFLDAASDGFVYFSLGTNVKSKNLQFKSLKAIVETLSELPYKILWKFEAGPETLPFKPDNVKLIKWTPQPSILAHPQIKAFVTQGGVQSMEEAIYTEVPCVVIPFFSDQHHNAKLMESKGIALIVSRYPHIEKEDLKNAIIEVINNPRYKSSVVRLKRLSQDTLMTGLEKAVWWTEYVIRNKGAKHLRNPAADLPLYQYYLLDVIAFLFSTLTIALSVLIILLKKIYKLSEPRFFVKSDSEEKKLL